MCYIKPRPDQYEIYLTIQNALYYTKPYQFDLSIIIKMYYTKLN